MQPKNIQQKIVGLIPAAGKAERISPLPCSKEIYPIGFHRPFQNEDLRIKVVSEYLLESMYLAGITRVYIILRTGKWDIPQFLGNGKSMKMNFAYLIMDFPLGVPFTSDTAYHFVKNDWVVFGFPDIIFKPNDAFVQLIDKGFSSSAEVVLGLFRAPRRHEMQHMVDFNSKGKINGFQIAPSQTTLQYTWIIAVWNQKFTRFLHEYVSNDAKNFRKNRAIKKDSIVEEISMTKAFQVALQKGLKIDSVIFEDGFFVDMGSPENLDKVVKSSPEFADLQKNK